MASSLFCDASSVSYNKVRNTNASVTDADDDADGDVDR